MLEKGCVFYVNLMIGIDEPKVDMSRFVIFWRKMTEKDSETAKSQRAASNGDLETKLTFGRSN
jgi:hypothetical protein